MREIPVSEVLTIVADKLANGGAFLNCSDGVRNNVMTIGWGGINTYFNSNCFVVPVRTSRYSHQLMQKNASFTVSIPLHDMRKELAFAGTKSGRDVDKFSGHGLTAIPAQSVDIPIVQECELHLECVAQGTVQMTADLMGDDVLAKWYPTKDMHTLYFGKIVRCYYLD